MVTSVNGKLVNFGNLNVKSASQGTIENAVERGNFYLIIAKGWTTADSGGLWICDWNDGTQPRIYTVQKSNTFSIATNDNGTITTTYNGYTTGVYLSIIRLL